MPPLGWRFARVGNETVGGSVKSSNVRRIQRIYPCFYDEEDVKVIVCHEGNYRRDVIAKRSCVDKSSVE